MWDVARSPISDYKRLYYTVLYTQFGIKSINQDNIAEMKKNYASYTIRQAYLLSRLSRYILYPTARQQ